MIEQNRKINTLTGVAAYHEAGLSGQGHELVIIDNAVKRHGEKCILTAKEAGPDLKITYFDKAEKTKAIDYCFANKQRINAISLSWESGPDSIYYQLKDLDIPTFMAAGNDSREHIASMNSQEWVFTVTSWWWENDTSARYNNRGEAVDCCGPAPVAIPWDNTDRFIWFSGTSVSTPYVAASVALLPKMTRAECAKLIKEIAQDKLTPGWDSRTGHGLFVLPKLEVPKMRDINLLHPDLKVKAEKLIELAKGKGINIILSQTWRTKAEQDAIYAQGRTAPGNVVSNVKYPNSLHCWG